MVFSRLRTSPYCAAVWTAITWVPAVVFFVDHGFSYALISGRSMQPTFNPDSNQLKKDIVLLNKWGITNHTFNRGDVVTLTSPIDPKCLITKRIIALPGDEVKPLRGKESVKVPEGHCWVEGDEAFHSRDSNSFGTVPIGLIRAKVSYVLWPPSRIGPVQTKAINPNRVKSHS